MADAASRYGLTEGCAAGSTPIVPVTASSMKEVLAAQTPTFARWTQAVGYKGDPGSVCLVPSGNVSLAAVVVGVGTPGRIWDWAGLPALLPPGTYHIPADLPAVESDRAILGWALGCYRFARYRPPPAALPSLLWPHSGDRPAAERTIAAIYLARDLINTPASDMGPAELADAAVTLAHGQGATCEVIVGDQLLERNFPLVHAVGRASSRAPRLIDIRWGEPTARKVSLVGKGVCFNSGDLDIKPTTAMKLMKKDMGGAAILLGLAQLLMVAAAPIRLRLLIPAVENAVDGNAFRPLDVLRSRAGRTIEVGNTDAEGRLVLADALSEAASEDPDLLIDCATLSGAARVALGTELPAMFCNDDDLAAKLLTCGEAVDDPLWRLPLWPAYRRHLDSKIADLNNAPDLPFAGAITAALFLEEFVRPVSRWIHLDVMAWNSDSRPGRPEGGEAMGLRALAALIQHRAGEP